jgi:hypothetical protein
VGASKYRDLKNEWTMLLAPSSRLYCLQKGTFGKPLSLAHEKDSVRLHLIPTNTLGTATSDAGADYTIARPLAANFHLIMIAAQLTSPP